MKLLAVIALLAGCATAPPAEVVPPDPLPVTDALSAAQPEPLVELVDDTRSVIPVEGDCPAIDADESREVWQGGCTQSDGTVLEGQLVRYDGPEGSWVAAEGFSVRQDGELLLYLDGAIELYGEDDLLSVDAAASLCGVGTPCADGLVTVDLSFSLYPLVNYPSAYDATVSGVVAMAGDAPTSVDATWSIDDALCATEPVSGLFTLRHGERQALEMDGASRCDGCAGWSVQGLSVGDFCGVGL